MKEASKYVALAIVLIAVVVVVFLKFQVYNQRLIKMEQFTAKAMNIIIAMREEQKDHAAQLVAIMDWINSFPEPPDDLPPVNTHQCDHCGVLGAHGIYFDHVDKFICEECLERALWFYWLAWVNGPPVWMNSPEEPANE